MSVISRQSGNKQAGNKGASLPLPSEAALAQSQQLLAHLYAQIQMAGGWLPFDRYMELALYAPGLGYYSGGAAKFGAAGDFITAPMLTPFFGRTLARQVAQLFTAGGLSQILEFGAGNGQLAADILLELEALGQPCTEYCILELSGELRERQQQTLQACFAAAGQPPLLARVRWLDALPEQFRGVMLGNEVLDAMPVRLFARQAGQWYERGVSWASQGLVWQDRLAATAQPETGPRTMPEVLPNAQRATLPEALTRVAGTHDYQTETHEAAEAFLRTLAQRLRCGALLLIDYGFPAHEYYHAQRVQGTLIGHYRHHTVHDPFFLPGLTDLSAHVNFSGLTEAGLAAGLDLLGYTSQAHFLLNAGLPSLLMTLDPSEPTVFLPASNAVQKLLSEAEMGELFKVIGFSRGLDAVPDGFARRDRSHTL